MKFLVNSRVFFEHIKLAIQFNAYQITVTDASIIFSALRQIELNVTFVEPPQSFDIKFNRFRWIRIRDFIEGLPEQPLTVRLLEDRIDIRCDALFVV